MDSTECSHKALFLHDLNGAGALTLWLNLMVMFQPWITAVTVFLASTSGARFQNHRRTTQSFYGKSERHFVICTVFVVISILLFVIQALCIQVQRFCDASSISDGSYAAQWVAFCIIDGAMLGTSIQAWFNCMVAVRKPPPSGKNTWTPWWGFMAVEGWILSSPLVLLGMLLLIPIKGTNSCKQWRIVRYLQDWKAKHRGVRTVWTEWQAEQKKGIANRNAMDSKIIPLATGLHSTVDIKSPPPAYIQ